MATDDVPSRFAVDFAGATLLGIYRVEKKLADGGMGSVWLAEDTNLGREVVVKVPHVRFLGEAGFRARFKREITELVRLEHPSIVGILAQGTHEEIPFFVLQYLGGGSLEQRLEEAGDGPRDAETVLPWLRTIAATLDFVHGRGVVHRDVKPENILFDGEGHVFLSDFGVVKALDEDLNVTDAGTGIGSPKYMAPEQGLGRQAEGAADQYGLATTVYEAIAGRLPFEGDSALEILLNKQKEAPTHLADLAPDLPTASANAVMRCLATDPDDRFPSCQGFADAFLAGAGIFDRTPPAGTATIGEETAGRRLLATGVTAVLLAAVVLAVGLAAGWFIPGAPDEEAAFEVTLLSKGAEPRRVLRYRPSAGSAESLVIGIAATETQTFGEQEPQEARHPYLSMDLKLEVAKVARNGDISYVWKCERVSMEPAEDAPPPVRDAMRTLVKSLEGRTGTGRQNARGITKELSHDTPPPEEQNARVLFNSIIEILEQVSTPLPEEEVGIGARWEVSYPRRREGIRFTQTVTFELESLGENEARLKTYVAVAGLNQTFDHPDVPTGMDIRLTSGHGGGEGELTIDLDRLGDRTVRMRVEVRMDFAMDLGEDVMPMSQVSEIRYKSDRK